MNISTREKQTLRRNNPRIGMNSIATQTQNSFVTPWLYSLKNLPTLLSFATPSQGGHHWVKVTTNPSKTIGAWRLH